METICQNAVRCSVEELVALVFLVIRPKDRSYLFRKSAHFRQDIQRL